MTPPVIGFVPYRLRPGPAFSQVALEELDFPLGLTGELRGRRVCDLPSDAHLVFHPKSDFYWRRDLGAPCKLSVLISEPRSVHARHMSALRLFHRRFFRVLTRDHALLAAIPNGLFHNHTYSFLSAPLAVDDRKTRMCSLIASEKRDLPGHRLRHRIVERIRAEGLPVDIMGRAYAPFERKEDGLAPYRASVVIENSREPGYITEKLVDAALCRTVPIYWGAPDAGDWFDPSGLILCDDEDDIVKAIRRLDDIDFNGLSGVLEENRTRALRLMEGNRLAAEALAREIRGSKANG